MILLLLSLLCLQDVWDVRVEAGPAGTRVLRGRAELPDGSVVAITPQREVERMLAGGDLMRLPRSGPEIAAVVRNGRFDASIPAGMDVVELAYTPLGSRHPEWLTRRRVGDPRDRVAGLRREWKAVKPLVAELSVLVEGARGYVAGTKSSFGPTLKAITTIEKELEGLVHGSLPDAVRDVLARVRKLEPDVLDPEDRPARDTPALLADVERSIAAVRRAPEVREPLLLSFAYLRPALMEAGRAGRRTDEFAAAREALEAAGFFAEQLASDIGDASVRDAARRAARLAADLDAAAIDARVVRDGRARLDALDDELRAARK